VGNGRAERFIRILKENLLWVRIFDTVEELRLALLELRKTYYTGRIVEPPSRHRQWSVPNNFTPQPKSYSLQSGVPITAGGTRHPTGRLQVQ
jgi:hypothetical protein